MDCCTVSERAWGRVWGRRYRGAPGGAVGSEAMEAGAEGLGAIGCLLGRERRAVEGARLPGKP